MQMVRRLLTLAVVASSLLVSGASMAAAAEPNAIPPPVVTVDRGTIFAGESVIVSGRSFVRGEIVDVVPSFQGTALGQRGRSARGGFVAGLRVQTVADANGSFPVAILLDRVGQYIITATGLTTGRTGSVTVRVLANNALPVTGNDSSNLAIPLVGSAVAAAGIVVVVLARSRRRPSKVKS
jgi:LPXTG-motif cell wall-anchored protein